MATKRLTVKDKRDLRKEIVDKRLMRLMGNANDILDGIEDPSHQVVKNSYPPLFKSMMETAKAQLPGAKIKHIFKSDYSRAKVRVGDEYILEAWGPCFFDGFPECADNRVLSPITRYEDYVRYAEEHYANKTMYAQAEDTFKHISGYCNTAGQILRIAPYLLDFVSPKIKESLQQAERSSRLHPELNSSLFARKSEQLHTALAVASLLDTPRRTTPLFDVTKVGVVESDPG